MINETITLKIDDMFKLLKECAAEGIKRADTAGDYTASGIAVYAFQNFVCSHRDVTPQISENQ